MGEVKIIKGELPECLEDEADESFDLIMADPPYFRVLAESWDRQWKTRVEYLSWLGGVLDGFRRVLKPNGSLYVWASSEMAAYVEVEAVAPRFGVLSSIAWAKAHADLPPGDPRMTAFKARDFESQRTYFDETERVIFAEHRGADSVALGESGYGAEMANLRGDVIEPLRAYLEDERQAAGVTPGEVNAALESQMAGHYFGRSQRALPTAEAYAKLQALFNLDGDGHLRREYEDLRRPFFANRDGFTNVWTYAPAEIVKGRHPAEKPLDMMLDIVRASTREGARVLDAFAGSGTMTAACVDLGRDVVAIEMDAELCADIERRADRHAAARTGGLHRVEMKPIVGPLFA